MRIANQLESFHSFYEMLSSDKKKLCKICFNYFLIISHNVFKITVNAERAGPSWAGPCLDCLVIVRGCCSNLSFTAVQSAGAGLDVC